MTDLTPKNQFTNLTKPLGPFNPVALLHHSITEMYQCFFLFVFLFVFILFYYVFLFFSLPFISLLVLIELISVFFPVK